MNQKRVIVIGAGPAGLAAVLSALKEGARVCVLDHMDAPGRKLLLTGNGQCNLSNTEVGPVHYHGDEELIRKILSGYTYEDAIRFWKELGVETETVTYRHETCGYLYPKTHRSETVLEALLKAMDDLGGKRITGCRIERVEQEEQFRVITDQGEFYADSLIFATGSNACPKTGSDSSIYPILKNLGIEQKTWLPALVALKSDAKELMILKGLRADASVVLEDQTNGKTYTSPDGEVQFRDHYVSGLPVLQVSRYAAIALKQGHKVCCRIKLKKATNRDGVLPFEEVDLNITGTEGFDRAITCSGGIPAEELNRKTLESLRIPGLYFAGEMIDIDGDCGGFNLHFAFASGLLAGRNAAK